MKILSIDAWGSEDGWQWNNWYTVGNISKEEFEQLKTNKDIRHWFKRNGFTKTASKRIIGVEDDQYNIVLTDRTEDNCPKYAIEYGPEY